MSFDLDLRLANASDALPSELQISAVLTLLKLALEEDLAPGGFEANGPPPSGYDVTGLATIQPGREEAASIFSKAPGVLAGLPLAEAIFCIVDPEIEFQPLSAEGEPVAVEQTVATLKGPAASLLAGERTSLNFLGRLSGIATLTRKFVTAVEGTGAVILDTRKTLPGYRILDKYAVRIGGGQNHRMGLYDMILIKNNHIDSSSGVSAALAQARQRFGNRYGVEVEVRSLEELLAALEFTPDRIMLDNMDLETMRRAVELSGGKVPLEASGNISLSNVRDVAETGVDFISVGALTHSVQALDISMHIENQDAGSTPVKS